jgi:hypothetical protein
VSDEGSSRSDGGCGVGFGGRGIYAGGRGTMVTKMVMRAGFLTKRRRKSVEWMTMTMSAAINGRKYELLMLMTEWFANMLLQWRWL